MEKSIKVKRLYRVAAILFSVVVLVLSIIIFNAEADDQTMIGYLTAQTNSYYFGQLRSLDSVNNNRINTEEQLTTIIGDHIT